MIAAFVATRFLATNRIVVERITVDLAPSGKRWRVTAVVSNEYDQGVSATPSSTSFARIAPTDRSTASTIVANRRWPVLTASL